MLFDRNAENAVYGTAKNGKKKWMKIDEKDVRSCKLCVAFSENEVEYLNEVTSRFNVSRPELFLEGVKLFLEKYGESIDDEE